MGGYAESLDNLSEEDGCAVKDEAKVYGNARVSGNALVHNHAEVYDNVAIYEFGEADGVVVNGNMKLTKYKLSTPPDKPIKI